jgi:putative heme-binding domain-containing protein
MEIRVLTMRITVASLLSLFLSSSLFLEAQQKEKPKWPPSPHVAETDPLRPEEQMKKLKLPPGFEIQLVAADPDIRKPINIAFDAAGRLWVTETIEYPFPAPADKGRDAVKILEDFGPDGKARKITTFADKLNIPIGVFPTAKGALVYSIPSITHMIDSKGTGKADVREALYTGFGFNDTHGMTGEFVQGFDGWIYCCHGYANTSNVKSRGDTAITMTSGNTYRIKADGSRIEHFTIGQVNPFGLTFDPYGNLYSADCHSRPLTLLLRGAWYESFSRPHDGLGFAPHMNNFDGHSTALCGVTYYAANQYPKEYQGMLFLGDVVLNRINAYRLEWTGTTPKAIMQPFVTSSDPWFRPVDIKLGPDGCLYFADFYNRIIGHYEVPLNHPGRDHDKGRIWRIVYRGPDGKAGPLPVKNLATANVKELVEALASPNLEVRLHATNQLVERGGEEAADSVQIILNGIAKPGDGSRKAHALWVAERLGKLSDDTLAMACSSPEKEVRVHAQRILTEKKIWRPKLADSAKLGLLDKDAFVQRVAVEALAAHPVVNQLSAILTLRHAVPANDPHLLYAVRLALREHLRVKDALLERSLGNLTEQDERAIADVCLSIKTELSAEYLKSYLSRYTENQNRTRDFAHHIVRYGKDGSVMWALRYAPFTYPNQEGAQGTILKAVVQASQERGSKWADDDRDVAEAIVGRLLESAQTNDKQLGAELAGTLRLVKTQPTLLALIGKKDVSEGLRKTCITTLVSLDAKQAVVPLTKLLLNDKEAIAIREQVANALAGSNHPDAHAALVQALQNAPARLQTVIAHGMSSNPQGGDRLLQAIENGKASPHLLQDRAIEIRLQQGKIANVQARLKKLMQGLPPADQKAQELISKRRDAFVSFKADAAEGQKVFQKQCASCHQISNQGAKIGPQLDGIGARGLERLLEDILDPNRNVDQAFRTTILTLKDGKSINGLFLREEGNVVILADAQGKEVRTEKAQIDERTISPLSPMPGNFAELIGESEFHHLLAYLLNQRGKS